jgi:hypothetical protein
VHDGVDELVMNPIFPDNHKRCLRQPRTPVLNAGNSRKGVTMPLSGLLARILADSLGFLG